MGGIHCCKGCDKREVGCHINCELYNICKVKYEYDKKQIRLYNEAHREINKGDYLGDYVHHRNRVSYGHRKRNSKSGRI